MAAAIGISSPEFDHCGRGWRGRPYRLDRGRSVDYLAAVMTTAQIIRQWRSAEREALAQLDAARTNSALKEAANALMRARRRLLQLEAEGTATA